MYVNSREQSVALVRTLRTAIPELGERISYYHAGLSRPLRRTIEEAFRGDRLCCIVSTSAFGEGVNLPGIRNVVLYHMPFGATEFNQMSGRAGRDGKPASIHLLFGSRDARINEGILAAAAPRRGDLVALYKALRAEERRQGNGSLMLSDGMLANLAQAQDESSRLDAAGVASGIAVFDELGFLHVEGYDANRRIVITPSPRHAELDESIRYSEGVRSVREFARFRDWVLSARPQEMLNRINRPIVPGFGISVGA